MNQKKCYIRDIAENSPVEGMFLVKDKNNGMTKGGKQYIALNLTDKTGEVKARIWDNAEKLGPRFSQGDVVSIRAFSVQYQGALQLNITAVEKVSIDGSQVTEFLPAAAVDTDAVLAGLLEICESIAHPYLKKLLRAVFGQSELCSVFKAAPAAKSIHHDYIGGLIEHTASVTRLALAIAPLFPYVDRDLLLTGALLHDIGKIRELSYEKGFGYTDCGRLIGHITLGDEMIAGCIREIEGFPEDLALVVRHLLLSHHGQYEFGSPKRPKTPEALLLSYLDDLDAKMFGFAEQIRKEKSPESKWTSYSRLFERYLYTSTFRDESDAEPTAPGSAPPRRNQGT